MQGTLRIPFLSPYGIIKAVAEGGKVVLELFDRDIEQIVYQDVSLLDSEAYIVTGNEKIFCSTIDNWLSLFSPFDFDDSDIVLSSESQQRLERSRLRHTVNLEGLSEEEIMALTF